MSLGRFVGYFVALSACSTIAFASCLMGKTAPQMPASLAETPGVSVVPDQSRHHTGGRLHRQVTLKTVLVARAD